MKVHHHELSGPLRPGSLLAIGWYDGVHQGHRHALTYLRRIADECGEQAGLILLDDNRPTARLTSIAQRVEILTNLGLLDHIWVVETTETDWAQGADSFIRELLVDRLRASAVLTATDDTHGPPVEMFAARLSDVAIVSGYKVVPLRSAYAELDALGARTSSNEVSALLNAGDVQEAKRLLGRPHSITGEVERGDQRGRTLGFPTANITLPVSFVVPKAAVYAGVVTGLRGGPRLAAISLGRRPTFYPNGFELVEAHILDFSGDLYGQTVSVEFHRRLRDQIRFETLDELVSQLHRDVACVRELMVKRQSA